MISQLSTIIEQWVSQLSETDGRAEAHFLRVTLVMRIISKNLSLFKIKAVKHLRSSMSVIQGLLQHLSDASQNPSLTSLSKAPWLYLAVALLSSPVHLLSRLSSCPVIFSLSASSADCAILPPSAWSMSTVAFRSSSSLWSNWCTCLKRMKNDNMGSLLKSETRKTYKSQKPHLTEP